MLSSRPISLADLGWFFSNSGMVDDCCRGFPPVAHFAFSQTNPEKSGGLNGSTQYSARTQLALKTKAKIAR